MKGISIMSKLVNTSREFKGDYTIVTNAYMDNGMPHEVLVTQEIYVKDDLKEHLDEAAVGLGMDGLHGAAGEDSLFYKSSVVLTIVDLHSIMGKIEKHRRLKDE
jgi:hypothetical protein